MAREIDFKSIIPARSDRVFLAGQTGSGKTTLARVLLKERLHVAVLDVKGRMRWPGYVIVTDLATLSKIDPKKVQKIIYKPTYDDLQNEEKINQFFRWVYDRNNTTLYVDELAGIANGNNYPYYYGACLMRGREKGIEVFSGTQRPIDIPQVAISESEHVYCFRLRLPQDRQKIANTAGIPIEMIAGLSKRQFLYAPQDGDIIGPLSLALDHGPSDKGSSALQMEQAQ
jgi:hypothetical protein